MTDGISGGEIARSIDLIREFQAKHPDEPLVIHAINLIGSEGDFGNFARDSTDQPAFVLAVLANETRGTVVSIPMPLRP